MSANNNKWVAGPSREMMEYLEGDGEERIKLFQNPGLEPDTAKPEVKRYLRAFNEWNERKNKLWNGGLDVDKAYAMVREYAPLPKTEVEIQSLLDLIPEEAAAHAGVFISYLVNEVYPYDEIKLRTGKPIGKLGTRNSRKRWVIIGNVGDDAGCDMAGGELVVGGNAGNCLGICMKGGKIIVEGNAGKWVGAARYRGEIHLCGTYESIWSEKGGAIYHKGSLIA